MLGGGSALGWRFRPQLVSGVESPWEAGLVLGFVLEPLNFRLIPRPLQLCLESGPEGLAQDSPSILLSVGKRARVAFTWSLPQMGRGELLVYQDVYFLPG